MKTKNYFNASEMRQIIDGTSGGNRIPMTYNFWSNPEALGENADIAKDICNSYPYDIEVVRLNMPQVFGINEIDPSYSFTAGKIAAADMNAALDEQIAIEDWDELDYIANNFAKYTSPLVFPTQPPEKGEKYRLATWWFTFFERHWSLRGMENALTDFYIYPERVHQLYDMLCSFYEGLIDRCALEINADGIFTTDDLGTQESEFFSEGVFVEFFKPYYKRIIDRAHSHNMHYWLHSCGTIYKFLPHFVEIGLDVLHPIQKYTMDEAIVAEKFGKDITICAGFDVQQIIPYGTPEDCRDEVRRLIDTYYRSNGKLILTFGNGITSDCPIESFRAVYDESYNYGIEKCKWKATKIHNR